MDPNKPRPGDMNGEPGLEGVGMDLGQEALAHYDEVAAQPPLRRRPSVPPRHSVPTRSVSETIDPAILDQDDQGPKAA